MKANNSIAQDLAAKYGVPFAKVEKLLQEETAQLNRDARIATYVPIISRRRVEDILRSPSRQVLPV